MDNDEQGPDSEISNLLCQVKLPIYVEKIKKLLPHRYPFLLLDKVIKLDSESIIGIKNFSFNEPVFQGHFPSISIVPGVLMVEASAQISGVHYKLINNLSEVENIVPLFVGINNAKFKKVVRPGDQLKIVGEKTSQRKNYGKYFIKGFVESETVFQTEIACMFTEKLEQE